MVTILRNSIKYIFSIVAVLLLLFTTRSYAVSLNYDIDAKVEKSKTAQDILRDKIQSTIRTNKIKVLGSKTAEKTFGYDVNYVLKVITAEAGGDGLDQCLGVTQAIHNAFTLNDKEYTPEEICEQYQYTNPADHIADDAKTAFIQIFIDEEMYEEIGMATIMYSTRYVSYSNFHESQIYVTTINNVKYFKETKWI